MRPLPERLSEFARALLAPSLAVPPGLHRPDGRAAERRFGVYRNNVVVGLIEALKANYPATCRIVGDEFFTTMARVYVAAEPPATPMLFDYGATFPDFLSGFEPAACLPYLPDVARIERAWTEAYHAPDEDPLDPERLTEANGFGAGHVRLVPHPSLRIVSSQYPALTIWRMNVKGGEPAPLTAEGGEHALVVRSDAQVIVSEIDGATARFIASLRQGDTLLDATKSAYAADGTFDLSGTLVLLFSAGAFSQVQAAAQKTSPQDTMGVAL